MPDNNMNEALRLRRAKMLELKAQERLRNQYGSHFASVVADAMGKPVSLVDFDGSWQPQLSFQWPREIAAAPGLVAANVSRDEASRLLHCFQKVLVAICGRIGFHDKSYLGFARLEDINPTRLLRASELAEDSVLFHVENPMGIILVDCYPSQPSEPFSIVVQGDDLVSRLQPCFMQTEICGNRGVETNP